MQKINGKYANAVIFSNTAEDYAIAQVKLICDSEAAVGSKIRVMPDVHPGKIGPIGLTMTIKEKIMPGLVGVDIGCGVSYMEIKNISIEFKKLDKVIREEIPVGSSIRGTVHPLGFDFDFSQFKCVKHINQKKAQLSLGALGGGNHFIELGKDNQGRTFVFVHSGSRHLGTEVAEYYLKAGQKELKMKGIDVPYEMTFLEDQLAQDYLHDVSVVQQYADLNRKIMLKVLEKSMKWKAIGFGECVHNYIDKERILRKGAVAAYANSEVIVPINMRDGIILGTGKANEEWNYSAPHGAGRVLSRSEVKNHHTVSEYKQVMKNVYSSTICSGTLDEAPFAYRGLDEIRASIGETVEVHRIIKPIYNYKAKR